MKFAKWITLHWKWDLFTLIVEEFLPIFSVPGAMGGAGRGKVLPLPMAFPDSPILLASCLLKGTQTVPGVMGS